MAGNGRQLLIQAIRSYRSQMTPSQRARSRHLRPIRWLYPWSLEKSYANALGQLFRPLRQFIDDYWKQHGEAILRGDSWPHIDEFNEEDHPRDETGKFTSGGGSGGLSDSQHTVLAGYALRESYRINGELRDYATLSSTTEKEVQEIDQAVAAQTPADYKVYRGGDDILADALLTAAGISTTGKAGTGPTLNKFSVERLKGVEIIDKGFLSTTTIKKEAEIFADQGDKKSVLFELTAKNMSAIDMSQVRGNGDASQKEVLFGRGLTIRITSAELVPVVEGGKTFPRLKLKGDIL